MEHGHDQQLFFALSTRGDSGAIPADGTLVSFPDDERVDGVYTKMMRLVKSKLIPKPVYVTLCGLQTSVTARISRR